MTIIQEHEVTKPKNVVGRFANTIGYGFTIRFSKAVFPAGENMLH